MEKINPRNGNSGILESLEVDANIKTSILIGNF